MAGQNVALGEEYKVFKPEVTITKLYDTNLDGIALPEGHSRVLWCSNRMLMAALHSTTLQLHVLLLRE